MKRFIAPGWTAGFVTGISTAGLVALLVIALVLPVNVGLSGTSAQVETTPEAETPDESASAPTDAVEVVQRVSPAVVTVINRQTGSLGSFGSDDEDTVEAGLGTGFIIDDDGHVVTNWHVVEGGDEFVVLLSGGEQRDAELVGSDRLSDLAVLDMEGDVPATVPFGDSDALQPGQTVIAIGSPLGTFTSTVTQGIVSALNRDFGQFGGDPRLYNNLIQHDAAINPGNSGGPLFTLAGEVVGVNTIGITETGGEAVAQGLFFAVPSNTVQEVVSEILENGEVQYPFFGISSAPVTTEIASELDLPVDYGNVVIEVEPGSGADEAGIEPGDVVLEVDGQRIDFDTPFIEVLFDHEPGDTVEVLIQRGDEQITVDVTLTELDISDR